MTSRPPQHVTTAAARAAVAKQQLIGTAAELKLRLSPRYIAKSTADKAKHRAISTANSTIDVVRQRPYLVGMGIAAIGLFLARGRIAKLINKSRAQTKAAPSPSPAAPRATPKRAAPRRRATSSQSTSKKGSRT